MKSQLLLTGFVTVAVIGALGCLPDPPPDPGGLKAEDFRLISLNGLDPNDNAVDLNDYCWAMEYFKPDDSNEGRIYVATGNDMVGLIYQGISAVMGMGELGEVSAKPPEIRRYRPDISPMHWERVLDYRDVELEPNFSTIGFRFMKTYRAKSNGKNYLYAATMGTDATLWRTASGAPGDWEIAWSSGQVGSIRYMAEHKGILYLALANEAPKGEQIGKIYATDGEQIWAVVEDGFGNPENKGVMCLASFNGWLYAGTMNTTEGYEVWKLSGPNGNETPIQVVRAGGPSPTNGGAITPCVFQDRLYLGAQIYMDKNVTMGFKGADMIRIDTQDRWETVVGWNSISGYGPGFSHWPNAYLWSMTTHQGWLYAGTYDQVSPFFNILEHPDKLIKAFWGKARVANIVEVLWNAGADLYKTQDGVTWYPVTLNGLGDVGNYGFRTLVSVGDLLYLGTTNPFDGLEVWLGGENQ